MLLHMSHPQGCFAAMCPIVELPEELWVLGLSCTPFSSACPQGKAGMTQQPRGFAGHSLSVRIKAAAEDKRCKKV